MTDDSDDRNPGYRSLRDLVLPLGALTLITGANGSGKSSVYRSLRLLAETAQNSMVGSLAREGGLPSTFWAGPEVIARSVRQGTYAVELLAQRGVASLKLGFGGDEYGSASTWAIRHRYIPCSVWIHTRSASASGTAPCTANLPRWWTGATILYGSPQRVTKSP